MTVDASLLDLLFNGANLFVLPFWTLMVLVPNTKLTRTVMGSLLPFVALAGLYPAIVNSKILGAETLDTSFRSSSIDGP